MSVHIFIFSETLVGYKGAFICFDLAVGGRGRGVCLLKIFLISSPLSIESKTFMTHPVCYERRGTQVLNLK